jgi:hypothetical protein
MRRRPAPRPFAPALQRVADSVMPATLLAEVQRVWPEAAGTFGAVTMPISERSGVVSVRCGSAVVASELNLLSSLVIDRVNDALGRPAVTGLRTDGRPLHD